LAFAPHGRSGRVPVNRTTENVGHPATAGRGKVASHWRLRAARVPGVIFDMARCTAPVRGHRSAAAAADCPACGSRYGRYSGYSYGGYSAPSYSSSGSSGGGWSSGGGSGSSARPRWSRGGSSVAYTTAEVRALTPIRETVEKLVPLPEGRDFFLCHAWDDRAGAAKELHDLLQSRGVSVWFSEKTSASVHRSFAKLTKDWRSRKSESCW